MQCLLRQMMMMTLPLTGRPGGWRGGHTFSYLCSKGCDKFTTHVSRGVPQHDDWCRGKYRRNGDTEKKHDSLLGGRFQWGYGNVTDDVPSNFRRKKGYLWMCNHDDDDDKGGATTTTTTVEMALLSFFSIPIMTLLHCSCTCIIIVLSICSCIRFCFSVFFLLSTWGSGDGEEGLYSSASSLLSSSRRCFLLFL